MDDAPDEPKVQVDPKLLEEERPSEPQREREPAADAPREREVRRDSPSRERLPEPTEDPATPSARPFGLPLWGWVLLGLGLLGLALLLDLRNRNRFMLVCEDNSVDLHQARRLPFPVGHEPLGSVEPARLAAGERCTERVFESRNEAEQAFLELLLRQVRLGMERPGGQLEVRRQALQAQSLSRAHPALKKEAEELLGELAYRQARQSLARLEDTVREALERFREAKKWGGGRHTEVDGWIAQLEALLKTVAPSPTPPPEAGLGAPSLLFPLPPVPRDGGPRDGGISETRPAPPAPARDASRPTPDARVPGILM